MLARLLTSTASYFSLTAPLLLLGRIILRHADLQGKGCRSVCVLAIPSRRFTLAHVHRVEKANSPAERSSGGTKRPRSELAGGRANSSTAGVWRCFSCWRYFREAGQSTPAAEGKKEKEGITSYLSFVPSSALSDDS